MGENYFISKIEELECKLKRSEKHNRRLRELVLELKSESTSTIDYWSGRLEIVSEEYDQEIKELKEKVDVLFEALYKRGILWDWMRNMSWEKLKREIER